MEKKELEQESNLSRRTFIGTAAVAGAVLAACAPAPKQEEIAVKLGEKLIPGPISAPDGKPLKAGLVGCGGCCTGAAINFLQAGPNLKIVALADTFDDRLQQCREALKAGKQGNRHVLSIPENISDVPDDKCFVGFDAYKKLLETDIDIVILATPPHFRPMMFEAAVEARKHVFMEKPVAVDPVGAKLIMKTAEKADAFGLTVGTGTQRRHQREYIETYNRIAEGMIGKIVASRCYWNTGQLWYKERQSGWSDMEWMIRDWVNWGWLSGDHIVEQHVHNIDVVYWFTNTRAASAVAMGARQRRVTGDQYDFFAVDFELEDGAHALSMCRQIDGCANSVSEYVVGTKGSSNCQNTIYGPDGEVIWEFKPAEGEEINSPYVQEHVDMVKSIREGKPYNEAVATATSNLMAIMGRTAAYTGKAVTWDEMMASDVRLGPAEYNLGPVDIKAEIPVPGTAEKA